MSRSLARINPGQWNHPVDSERRVEISSSAFVRLSVLPSKPNPPQTCEKSRMLTFLFYRDGSALNIFDRWRKANRIGKYTEIL